MNKLIVHRFFSTCNNVLTSEAYVSIHRPDDEYKTSYASVYGVKTSDGFTRRGIGSMLVSECIDWAGSKGIHVVLLVVKMDNYPAISIYKKLGFHIFRNHKLDSGYYIMRKFI